MQQYGLAGLPMSMTKTTWGKNKYLSLSPKMIDF